MGSGKSDSSRKDKMAIDAKAMGKRIKAARQKAGLTQEQLAEIIDVSVVHISNMESGTGNPSLNTLVNIANVLGVSTDELLCDSVVFCKPVFQKEMNENVADCNDFELRVLTYILKSAKAAIRDDQEFRKTVDEYEQMRKKG